MKNSEEATTKIRTRRISRFDWEEVSPRLIRKMLEAVYEDAGQNTELADLARMPDGRLALQAQMTLGRPLKSEFDKIVAPILLHHWLPKERASRVIALATLIQAGTKGDARYDYIARKPSAIPFLRQRRHTHNFLVNLRKAFVSAHLKTGEVTLRESKKGERPGIEVLQGRGSVQDYTPYKHQIEARMALDTFYANKRNTGKGCLIVLPTGSGKTETVVEWLLAHLEEDESARVLWIAHQQELLDQSIQRFKSLAASRPASFRKNARAIHGRGSRLSTLADASLDVAAVTFQSLAMAVSGPQKGFVDKYFERPVYVIVDEVHHAGARAYRKLITSLSARHPKSMIGLTATPTPSSLVNRYHLKQRFPHVIYRTTPEQLMAKGILAQPILNIVTTNLEVELDKVELKQSEQGDLSPAALRHLERQGRNLLIADTWKKKPKRWGKTLVFATRIQHADELVDVFKSAGADTRSLHSLTGDRKAVLDWFRQATGSPVLISVGMLTEGIDLPSARTAFLSRPTTSRVLLKQMIGRVLRGPRAGGEATAELVYFEDSWSNFLDLLGPAEVLPDGYLLGSKNLSEKPGRLPEIIRGDNGQPVPQQVGAAVERQFQQAAASHGRKGEAPAIEVAIYSSNMTGYYDLEDQVLPVFEHQLPGYKGLLAGLKQDSSLRGIKRESFFEELRPPYPPQRGLREFVGYYKEFDETPVFHELKASLGPQSTAQRVVAAGALTEKERARLIRESWQQSLSHVAYPNLDRFEEAVELELREQRSSKNTYNPEKGFQAVGKKRLPNIPGAVRKLDPLVKRTIETARTILPRHIRGIPLNDIPVKWTSKVFGATFANWSIKLYGRNAGTQIIRVNCMLRAPASIVSDEALQFLIYHEMLHHLLPGQGHDAEFRELEFLWPEVETQMAFFDTLHEHYNLDPEYYRR